MRFAALAPVAALGLLAACGGGPTAEEEALPETGSHPEVTANSAAGVGADMGNPSTVTAAGETVTGDQPVGPVSDQGSGSGDATGQ